MTFILLQAKTSSASSQLISNLIFIGGIILVFYFFMIRPQAKKQKDQKNFITSIKKGDKVVTIGGLYGKVYAVDEETVTLEVDKSVKLTFDKNSISQEYSKRYQEKGENA
ncbi:MAG TPA: preprotein translocase subunit YajC [Microscillaceae bacterium]|nr:preprotein translocase subunit YajC [Microscillaceae bacterium]